MRNYLLAGAALSVLVASAPAHSATPYGDPMYLLGGSPQTIDGYVTKAPILSSLWANSTSVTLGAAFSYKINVKLLGAKGDGVTDDTAAFQAALNQAATLNVGAEIEVPPGHYILSNALQETFAANQGVYVHGAGQIATLLDFQHPTTATDINGFDIKLGTGSTVNRPYRNTACSTLSLSGQTVGTQACDPNGIGGVGFFLRDMTIMQNEAANHPQGDGVRVTSGVVQTDSTLPFTVIQHVSFVGSGSPTNTKGTGVNGGCGVWTFPVHLIDVPGALVDGITVQGSMFGALPAYGGCTGTGYTPDNVYASGAGVFIDSSPSYNSQSQGVTVSHANIKYYDAGVAISGTNQGDSVTDNNFFGLDYGVVVGGSYVMDAATGSTTTATDSGTGGATSITIPASAAASVQVGMLMTGAYLPLAKVTAVNTTTGVVSYQSIVGTGGTQSTTAGNVTTFSNSSVTFTNGYVMSSTFGSGGLTVSTNGIDVRFAGVYAPTDNDTFIGFNNIVVSGNSFLQNTSASPSMTDVVLGKSDADIIEGNYSVSPHGAPSTTAFLTANWSNTGVGGHGPVVDGNKIDTSGSTVPAIQFTGQVGYADVHDNDFYNSTIFASDDGGTASADLWGCNSFMGSPAGTVRKCGLVGIGGLTDLVDMGGRWEADRAAAGLGAWHGLVFGSVAAAIQGTSVSVALTPSGGAGALPSGVTAASPGAVAGSYTVPLSSAAGVQAGMTAADGAAIPAKDTITGISGTTATVGPYPLASAVTAGDTLTFGYGPALEIAGNVNGSVGNGELDGVFRCHSSDGGNRFAAEVTGDYQSGIMAANTVRLIISTNGTSYPSGVSLTVNGVTAGKPIVALNNANTTAWSCHGLPTFVPDPN